MSNQGKIEELLLKILQQESLSRNEICCKLRELITEIGGSTTEYNTVTQTELNDGGVLSIPASTYHSITFIVVSGSVDISIGGGPALTYSATTTATFEATTLLTNTFDLTVTTGRVYIITQA